MHSVQEIVEIAEELLTDRFGGTQRLSEPSDLGGSGNARVLRVRVAPQPFLQARSVVLKYVPRVGDRFDDAALIREVVAYQFCTSLPVDKRPGPELLAYDIDRRILVIGDAGDGDTLDVLLDTTDSKARLQVVRKLGRSLGSIHAATADREEHFTILLKRMLARYPHTSTVQQMREVTLPKAIDRGLDLLVAAGITVDDQVQQFATEAQRRLVTGQHRAFTPFDLSPDNILLTAKPQFLDYEWAGFRDATFDVACVIGGFPQFLFAHPLTDSEAEAFVDAWVDEVKTLWPNVTNRVRLRARLIAALIGWAASSVAYLYHGSMHQLVAEMEQRMQQSQADAGDIPALDAIARSTAEWDDDVLAGSLFSDMSEEGQLARKDVADTFTALARLAHRGGDPRFAAVATFAESVLARLAELDTSLADRLAEGAGTPAADTATTIGEGH
ncbi:phosphotransferase family protein [Corynebacterium choanae]|uniref:Phosphotransferase enzyme family protein n=1 Tax=Corynebacterium choanae TaxID=1862358 RepID=A0A3G6J6F1_9CORY|nr:phosphotransferase [Corynebacterium choanae]AZA13681.1 hypothetical protein CCHOA_06410 [Corynebacterium choanae]